MASVKKRNSMVRSGNFGDTAKDNSKSSTSTLAFRLVELAQRLNNLQCCLTGNYIPNSQKGVANGVATLDGTGVLTAAQVPPYLLGALNYQGTWDASGGVPPAVAAPANKGHYYIISVAGTIGGVVYNVGDLIVSTGATWERIDGATEAFLHLTDTPTTYAGQQLKLVRVNEAETALEYQDLIPNTLVVVESGNAGEYTTIAAAILDASDGDVILVTNGIYTEDLTITNGITIKGECALETQINGKITFSPAGASKAVISQIGIVNTNDFCIDCQPTNDSAVLKCVDVRLESTWNSGVGQTTATAKACVKLSRGTFINSGAAQASITASGDNTNEHNTCIYWVTGSDTVFLESFGIIHSITNTTDTRQNLEIMFNNNTNVNGVAIIKNGFCRLTGVVNASNYIAPFYMFNSNNTAYIDGNILFLFNSGHSYATFHYQQSATSTFSNNTIIHSGITAAEVYIGYTLSTTGRIKIINNYYDTDFIPKVSGNVEYFYSISDGDTYHSKGFVAKLLTVTDANYVILDNDGIYTVVVSTGAADRTITLPTAADNNNRIINIKKIDAGAGNVIVDGEGAETIDGALTLTIAIQYDSYSVQSNGSNWYII